MDEFKELEFKYDANSINLTDFLKLMQNLQPKIRKDVSSWDYYYTCNNPEEFLRYRESKNPELTIKRKTKSSNNWDRIEVDLPLDENRIDKYKVDAFSKLLSYKENFRIYKTCFIFWFNDFNAVYYVVYDENMKEKGRFIEVEINKDRISNLADPFETLKQAENTLLTLGPKPSNRLKRSLFEMFVKNND